MKLSSFTIVLVGVLSASCASNQKTPEPPRSPAATNGSSNGASGDSFDLDDSQYSILSDYFLSGDSQTRFIINRRFSTNADKPYLAERAEKSVHEAFAKAFADLANAQGSGDTTASLGMLVGGFKKNLPETLVSNFVKTIRFYKLINTRLQYDLVFEPDTIDGSSFDDELASNDLTNLATQGSLMARLQKSGERAEASKVLQYVQTVQGSLQKPVFGGGSISLAAEILRGGSGAGSADAPLVGGEIRLRRYLYHRAQRSENVLTAGALKVASTGFDPRKQAAAVSTVDFIYTIGVSNPRPKLKRVDIYPGRIVGTVAVGAKASDIQTASYEVGGAWGKKPFVLAIDRISLDGSSRQGVAAQMSYRFISGGGLTGLTEDFLFPEITNHSVNIFKSLTSEIVEPGGDL